MRQLLHWEFCIVSMGIKSWAAVRWNVTAYSSCLYLPNKPFLLLRASASMVTKAPSETMPGQPKPSLHSEMIPSGEVT